MVYCRVWFETKPYNVSPQNIQQLRTVQRRPFLYLSALKGRTSKRLKKHQFCSFGFATFSSLPLGNNPKDLSISICNARSEQFLADCKSLYSSCLDYKSRQHPQTHVPSLPADSIRPPTILHPPTKKAASPLRTPPCENLANF